MSLSLNSFFSRMIQSLGVDGLDIPITAVKFFRHDDDIPSQVMDCCIDEITLTSCQATRQAALGDAVCLTRENIGCVAAAISFGLVGENETEPLQGHRAYTDIMLNQSDSGEPFIPPTPDEFSQGLVYACKDSKREDFCLFGKEDSGRYKSVEIAKQAIKDMLAIQPPVMKAVFFFALTFKDLEIVPDVIVLSVRPVELTKFISAYQFNTGKRVTASMGAVRVVNSDLIVRPYLTGEMNISTYCLGARLLAGFEADRLGIGMPINLFKEIVLALESSQTGHPFHLFPGAAG